MLLMLEPTGERVIVPGMVQNNCALRENSLKLLSSGTHSSIPKNFAAVANCSEKISIVPYSLLGAGKCLGKKV